MVTERSSSISRGQKEYGEGTPLGREVADKLKKIIAGEENHKEVKISKAPKKENGIEGTRVRPLDQGKIFIEV